MTGIVRKMRVREGRKLTDRELAQRGLVVESLIRDCWIETLSPGPYKFKTDRDDKPIVDWPQVLQGDRVYALVQLGIHTYGPRYDFDCTCRNCGKRIRWSVDCENELDVYDLPDASREKIAAGDNSFEAEFKDTVIRFKLLTGADEKFILGVQEDAPETIMEQSLALRITSIEGVSDGDKLDWIRELGLDEALDLTDLFDAQDCGVESDILISCPRCFAEQEHTLPFDLDFILRTGRRRQRRRKRRQARKRSSRSTKPSRG